MRHGALIVASLFAISGCEWETPNGDFQNCLPGVAEAVEQQKMTAGGRLDPSAQHWVSESWLDACMSGKGWAIKHDPEPVCAQNRIPLCYGRAPR